MWRACRKGSRLIVGPWLHSDRLEGVIEGTDYGPEGSGDGFDMTGKLAQWFDHWLKGAETDFTSGAPVKLFVMGKNVWRDENEWPLARTRFTPFYLHSGGAANTLLGDGVLTTEHPEEEAPDHYVYDPMNPCPTATGEPFYNMLQDQRPIQERRDVLVFTAPAVTTETELTGPIYAELFVSTDALDTDFVARVSIVRKNGRVQRLGAKLVRGRYRNGKTAEAMTPGEIYKLRIEAANTCIVLEPGEAVRLDVISSLFPDADRNLNTFGKVGYETQGIVANQTLYHDRNHPSALILPIIPKA